IGDKAALESVATQIGFLHSLGIRIALVHGGGPQATSLSRQMGVEPVIVAGRRVTDDHALEVAKMVYVGKLNTEVLASLRKCHVQAVGLSGVDADLITAKRRAPVLVKDDDGKEKTVDFGHVGDVTSVDTRVLTTLFESRFVPVIASLAGDGDGNIY